MDNNKKISYLKLVEKVLEIANKPLTYTDIWNIAVENELDKKLKSIGKTPEITIASRLYANIRDRKDSKFIIISRHPTKYWIKNKDYNYNLIDTENNDKKNIQERHLYPLLVKYLKDSNFDCFSKTIMYKKGKNNKNGENRWNYPDIVAVHFMFNDNRTQKNFESNINKINHKIYSFRLKVRINASNFKESYFQAVSNSNFANEGYLVVFEDIDKEILDEINRLNQIFGIGLIKLEAEILKSHIIFPSFKKNIDSKALDILINKNIGIKKFVCNLNKDINNANKDLIIKENYDEILSDENMKKYLIENKIITL